MHRFFARALNTEEYTRLDFCLVLFAILVSKSLYYESYGSNLLLIPLLLALLILGIRKRIKINNHVLSYSILFLLLVFVNTASERTSVLVLFVRLLIGVLFVQLIPFKKFSYAFADIMKVLCFFSLFTYVVYYLDIPSILPKFIGWDSRELRNFVLFGVSERYFEFATVRNNGLWWEPGAFQIFINLAVLFEIINKSLSMKRYVFYLLVILTTSSTTAILAFSLLSVLFLKDKYANKRGNWKFALVPFVCGVFYFLAIPLISHKFMETSSSYASFQSRYYDVMISWELFKSHWLLGCGYGTGLTVGVPFGASYAPALSNTPAVPTGADGLSMMVAQCGVFTFLFLKPFVWPAYVKFLGIGERILIFTVIAILFNAENFSTILIFTLLSFYGIQKINLNSAASLRVGGNL